jgi:preprotein translocase subunit YajC
MIITAIFLQAAKPQGGGWETMILFGGIILVFYFFMIRPQQKKAKEQKAFRESIKKGDDVVTIGGLHGKVFSVEKDETVLLEVDKGIKLKFEKSSINADVSKKQQKTV